MSNKTFTKDFTKKIADLSRLNLTDKEVDYFTQQFNSTLFAIERLNELSTDSVDEAYNITGLSNVFREDKINPMRQLSQEEALSNAKRKYNGFFVVKGILNEK